MTENNRVTRLGGGEITLVIQASAMGYPCSLEIPEDPFPRCPCCHVPATPNSVPSTLSPGVVRQVRPIVGPFYAVLKLEMNYVLGGVVSHRNVVNVHIFVSEYWF